MTYEEQAVRFECRGDFLHGILCKPPLGVTSSDLAILIIVGGPQYRVGSHRQFVLLARSLAAQGYPVLRFDYRGMGDSEGQPRDFEEVDLDIHAAIDAVIGLQPQVRRVVLWGLCDAASAILLHGHQHTDPRVAGLCLLNPWVRSGASLARTQIKHYYLRRLTEKSFWSKLLRGGVAGKAVRELLQNARLARGDRQETATADRPFQDRMARAWTRFDGPILLVLSGNDYTAKEFLEFTADDASRNGPWTNALARPRLQRADIREADHTFSNADARQQVETLCKEWLTSNF